MRSESISHTSILSAIIAIVCVHSFITFTNDHYKIGSDAAAGLATVSVWEKNDRFNYQAFVPPDNLADENFRFLSWWTPGQYLVPWSIDKLIPDSLAVACKLLTIVGLFLAAIGYFLLYRSLRFNRVVSLASILYLFTLPQFFYFSQSYIGGGLLEFLFLPWAIFLMIRVQVRPLVLFCLLVDIGVIGFFLKSSFLVTFIGLIVATSWIAVMAPEEGESALAQPSVVLRRFFQTGIWPKALALVAVLLVAHGYNSLGGTPINSRAGFELSVYNSLFPLTAPIFGLLPFVPPSTVLSDWLPSLLFVVASLFIFVITVKSSSREARAYFLSVYFVTASFFILVFSVRAAVSVEVRHFIAVIVLFVPIALNWLFGVAQSRRLTPILGAIFALSCCMVFASYIQNSPSVEGARGAYGFWHWYADQDTLDKVKRLDEESKEKRAVFYFSRGEWELHVKHGRSIGEFNYFGDYVSGQKYDGTADVLYLVLNKDGNGAQLQDRDQQVKAKFLDYNSFELVWEGAHYSILKGVSSPLLANQTS